MERPLFNEARGAAVLTGKPPFEFEGVTLRVFPLRAEMRILRNFVNRFLNVTPEEIAHFRPYLPYVYLMVLNYGQMSSEVENTGWVAQNEVAFAVPLEWYRRENGRLTFQDWASVCPFIFVDDEMSQYTGREVYGWPKVHGCLEASVNPWTEHPRAPKRLKFTSRVFTRVFTGQRQQARTVLEILQDPPPTYTQVPFDPSNPLNPFVAVPRLMAESASALMEVVDAVVGLPIRGYGRETGIIQGPEKITRALRDIDVFEALPFFNTVNLKQFRDTEHPDCACFQAIINSRMTITRLDEAGLLGDGQRLSGDLASGYTIRLHKYDSFPVVQSLGIQVEREEEHDEGDGCKTEVAVMRPVLPFWAKVDFDYGIGEVVAQRTRDSGWIVPADGEDEEDTVVGDAPPCGNRFNTASGAANISVTGPFHFPSSAVRVLPLRADRAKLAKFVDDYLNEGHEPGKFDFRPWAADGLAYVFLVAQTYGEMSSEGLDLGQWANRSVRFVIPIQWRNARGARCVGTLSPFLYSDSEVGTATGREWLGWPMEVSQIESPDTRWMAARGPGSEAQPLLQVRAQSLSGANAGVERTSQTLLEITEGDVLPPEHERWSLVASGWGRRLHEDLQAKERAAEAHPDELLDLKALVLEVLAHGKRINDIALKQFRSSDKPETACFQELVQTSVSIGHVWTLEELEDPLHVRVHKLASQPIVETLGLEVKYEQIGSGGTVYHLQPVRPFWARLDLTAHGGISLAKRSASKEWDYSEHARSYFEDEEAVHVGREVVTEMEREATRGAEAERALRACETRRQNVAAWAREWWEELDEPQRRRRRLSVKRAAKAVETLAPSVALDSILSREWGNVGDSRAFRHAVLHEESVEQKPDFCVRRDSVGRAADDIFPLKPGDGAFRAGMSDVAGWYPGELDAAETARGAEEGATS